jgi:hypothetical protein
MTELLKNTQMQQSCITDVIKRLLFGFKYLKIDEETKLEYGFHFETLGKSYFLKKWSGSKWVKVSWTYHSTHDSKEAVLSYLISMGNMVSYKDKSSFSVFS